MGERCLKCQNLVRLYDGLHCNGYGWFGSKWAKKCSKNLIKGRFRPKRDVYAKKN